MGFQIMEVREGYKKTKVGAIPRGWDVVKLGDVCDVRDGTHDSPQYIENGIPFITSKNLTDKGLSFSNITYISKENHNSFSKRSYVENGDILFGMIGTIGKPIIIKLDFEISIKNVALIKFKKNSSPNNFFILNLLKSAIILSQFKKVSNGGVLSFIALGMIRNLQIPLPPLPEQKKIAEIFTTVDDKLNIIDEKINSAKELKKGLMQKTILRRNRTHRI